MHDLLVIGMHKYKVFLTWEVTVG